MSRPSLTIVITKSADKDETAIYKYISETFGQQYAKKFSERIIDFFRVLASHPFIGRPAKKDKRIRVFIVSKQNKLVYKPTHAEVVILRILNTRTKLAKKF